MTRALLQLSRALFLSAAVGLGSAPALAQDPASVDIDLVRSETDTTRLEVYLRANGDDFGDVLSGLTFTIRWVTTSPATLGLRVNSCPAGIPIAPTPQITNPDVNGIPTGFNYRTYNAFGLSLLTDEGCPLPQDTWYLVMNVPVANDTACTEFQIVNDEFTDSPGNVRDYFISLGGIEKTGVIEPTPVLMGDCDITLGAMEQGSISTFPEISPNPTTGLVRVSTGPATQDPIICRVFDALGRMIDPPGSGVQAPVAPFALDLSAEPDGVYFIELEIAGDRSVHRVVKH